MLNVYQKLLFVNIDEYGQFNFFHLYTVQSKNRFPKGKKQPTAFQLLELVTNNLHVSVHAVLLIT